MTTTRTHSAEPREPAINATPATLEHSRESSPLIATTRPAHTAHRNEVTLIGQLVELAEPRQRADIGEVLTFRVGVRTTPLVAGSTSSPSSAPPQGAGPGGRRDIVDCAVATAALRRRLESYHVGDVVEIHGALRHRFWNAGGRVQSRYEIEVTALKRVARARPAPG